MPPNTCIYIGAGTDLERPCLIPNKIWNEIFSGSSPILPSDTIRFICVDCQPNSEYGTEISLDSNGHNVYSRPKFIPRLKDPEKLIKLNLKPASYNSKLPNMITEPKLLRWSREYETKLKEKTIDVHTDAPQKLDIIYLINTSIPDQKSRVIDILKMLYKKTEIEQQYYSNMNALFISGHCPHASIITVFRHMMWTTDTPPHYNENIEPSLVFVIFEGTCFSWDSCIDYDDLDTVIYRLHSDVAFRRHFHKYVLIRASPDQSSVTATYFSSWVDLCIYNNDSHYIGLSSV